MRKFAFFIHPRDVTDIARRFWWAGYLPDAVLLKGIKLLKKMPGKCVCSSFAVYGKSQGFIIAIPFTASELIRSRIEARKVLLESVLYAQDKLGVEVIGLGALTSHITERGNWLSTQDNVNVEITTGNSYTVMITIEGVEKIIETKRYTKPTIGIVGATGNIGSSLARILSKKENCSLILIGRDDRRLKDIAKNLPGNSIIGRSLELLKAADIVITATNHPEALINEECLKEHAVIYDLAQPSNVSSDVLQKRPDVIRIDGGYVRIPGIELGFNMGPPKGTAFACLTETILKTLAGIPGHHIGDIDLVYAERIKEIGNKYGFSHAPFTCYGKPVEL